jgi:hypothetical protein
MPARSRLVRLSTTRRAFCSWVRAPRWLTVSDSYRGEWVRGWVGVGAEEEEEEEEEEVVVVVVVYAAQCIVSRGGVGGVRSAGHI